MNILILKLDAIGDVVLVTPFVRELRRSFPDATITIVVSPLLKPLMDNCPYLDEVKMFKRGGGGSKGPIKNIRGYLKLLFYAFTALRGRYDIALVPRWGADAYHATPLAFLSGARRRISFSELSGAGSSTRRFRDRFLNEVLTETNSLHERDINLELVDYLGGSIEERCLELWPQSFDYENISRKHDLVCGQFICVCPGSMVKTKEWSEECYIDLIQYIIDTYCPVVVIGGPAERAMGERIEKQLKLGCVSLAGKTSLNETAALLDRSLIYVGNDTGAMHMAVAMKTPVVMISCFPKDGNKKDLNSPVRFGPCPEVESEVIQPDHALPPCEQQCFSKEAHCILQVSLESVMQAIDRFMNA